jgi:hypothetical protein
MDDRSRGMSRSDTMRTRAIAAAGLILIVCIGLASRMELFRAVPVLGDTFGDGAWAAAVYAAMRFLLPRASIITIAACTLAIACTVECSQAWHPAWLDQLRTHRIVQLLIGRGFLWVDFIAYLVGTVLVAGIDRALRARCGVHSA